MISELVKQTHGRYVWDKFYIECNVCCHCGYVDDPDGRWAFDEDDDRICTRCAAGLDGKFALVKYDPNFHKFTWATVLDASEQALMNQLAKIDRQLKETLSGVRVANAIIGEWL